MLSFISLYQEREEEMKPGRFSLDREKGEEKRGRVR